MGLILTLKILGWIFTLVPLTLYLVISVKLIKGVGKDDPLILTFAMIGLSIFLMGVITLTVVYLTDYL